jgi:hypothetical protein
LSATALREVARLSSFEQGPLLAIEYLRELGIRVIIEPGLKGMLVDGAALLDGLGNPVIGLTMRYDRIDSYWFTLLHELIHIRDHVTSAREAFIDRIDFEGHTDEFETEANLRARDILIPRAHWRASEASASPNKASIVALAKAVQIHPAIVVGRVHAETKRFDRFRDMLGEGTLRDKLLERRALVVLYQPVLKMKENDLRSFTLLSQESVSQIWPIIEVLRPRINADVGLHLGTSLSALVACVPRGRVAVDLSLVPPGTVIDGLPASTLGFDYLRANGRLVSPVVSLHSDAAELAHLARVVSEHGRGIVVRLDGDDVLIPSDIPRALRHILESLSIDPSLCALAIDLGTIDQPASVWATRIERLLRDPLLADLKSISVGGSSLPKFVTESGASEHGHAEVRRVELDVAAALSRARDCPPTILLDHGIVHPEHMDDIRNKHINGKIRYTSGASVHYFRGCRMSSTPLRVQYPALVQRVVASPFYRGKHYSFGDEFLHKCAFEGLRCADLGQWVCVDNNHHLAATARQLEALRASAPITTKQELDELLAPV